jgi:hypothetical protein
MRIEGKIDLPLKQENPLLEKVVLLFIPLLIKEANK